MFRNNVYTFKSLPVEQKQRKWTDCCCTIVTAIFALTLFILSFVFFTRNNYYEVNYPVDSTGQACLYDQQNAPFLYLANLNDVSNNRYCVSSCPSNGGSITCTSGQCAGLASSYDSTAQYLGIGAYCVPNDPTLASKFWANPSIANKNSLVNGYDVILISMIVALCVGIVWLALVTCCPKVMTYAAFLLVVLLLITTAIVILAKSIQVLPTNGWNIALIVCLFLGALLVAIFFFCYQKQIEVASILMTHANTCLKESIPVWFYIPLWLIFTFGLFVLCLWQYIAFGTTSAPYYNQGDLYKTSSQNYFLQVLNAIEFIWGLQFLRDSFNFVVSGNAVEWYFKANNNAGAKCCRPFTRLLCRNWGSVVGGSFLNAFFNIFDWVFDLFRCDPLGSCGKCNTCYRNCCCCFDYVFGLARTDSYAYINLAGVPYCNASRQCQAMCQRSLLFQSSQSCLRLYRIASHIFLVLLIVLIDYGILVGRSTQANTVIYALLILVAYLVVTYFVDFHPDAAEGLMVCYLAEQNCEGEELAACPLQLRNDLYNYQVRNKLIR